METYNTGGFKEFSPGNGLKNEAGEKEKETKNETSFVDLLRTKIRESRGYMVLASIASDKIQGKELKLVWDSSEALQNSAFDPISKDVTVVIPMTYLENEMKYMMYGDESCRQMRTMVAERLRILLEDKLIPDTCIEDIQKVMQLLSMKLEDIDKNEDDYFKLSYLGFSDILDVFGKAKLPYEETQEMFGLIYDPILSKSEYAKQLLTNEVVDNADHELTHFVNDRPGVESRFDEEKYKEVARIKEKMEVEYDLKIDSPYIATESGVDMSIDRLIELNSQLCSEVVEKNLDQDENMLYAARDECLAMAVEMVQRGGFERHSGAYFAKYMLSGLHHFLGDPNSDIEQLVGKINATADTDRLKDVIDNYLVHGMI